MKKTPITKGFTLAEVLITLGVIGIVAALTIPTIMNYTFEKQSVSAAKKTYATLSSAVASYQLDNNCVGDSASCPSMGPGGPWSSAGTVASELAKYLKVADSSVSNPAGNDGTVLSWIPQKAYSYNGGNRASTGDIYPVVGPNQAAGYIRLSDGTIIMVSVAASDAGHNYHIAFDVNGVKGPNRLGKDQFVTSFYSKTHKSFNPYAAGGAGSCGWNIDMCWDSGAAGCDPCNADDGLSPLAYVLAHDKLPDLKKMGFPSAP